MGSTNFPKIYEPFQNYGRQKGHMKQVAHWNPKKSSRPVFVFPQTVGHLYKLPTQWKVLW